ncbi:S-layer homology domain-containing protein [Bacillus sp. AK128]
MKRFSSIILALILAISIFTPEHAGAAKSFPDVTGDFWAKSEIGYLTDLKVINGYENGKFGPNDRVKRVQAAVMIVRALELDTNNRPDPGYTDIPKDYFAYKEISALVDEGIFPKSKSFFPNEGLTRADMAMVLAKAYNLTGTYTGPIVDVPKNTDTYTHVSALAANGITKIYDDGTYKPKNIVNRAQFAVFFARVLDPSFRPQPENSRTIPSTKGVTWTVSVDDEWLHGEHKYEIELTDIITDGNTAWSMIEDANMFNDPAPTGKKYILAKFRVKLLELEGLTYDYYDVNFTNFDAVSKDGKVYEDYFSVVEPEPRFDADLYVGGETEGWVAFLVNEGDEPLIVWNRQWDDVLWFALK